MKHTKHYCSVFIFALALFAIGGCATTKSTGIGYQEGAIETTQKFVDNMDYTSQKIDANISSEIRLIFAADGLLSDSHINVDTNHCNVTLEGKVDTQARADRAMQLGRSVDGVRSVRSNLTVNATKKK